QGHANIVGLYSNPGKDPEKDEDLVTDWQGLAFLDLHDGHCFLGMPQRCEPSLSVVLQWAYKLARDVSDIRYGIAYLHEYFKGPDFYALGIIVNPDPDTLFDPETLAAHDRISKWQHERIGEQRHLRGWFRDAYSASILSQAHVDAHLLGRK